MTVLPEIEEKDYRQYATSIYSTINLSRLPLMTGNTLVTDVETSNWKLIFLICSFYRCIHFSKTLPM